MKSIKFSSKSFLSHRINSHWYLGLLYTIIFILSMPFALTLVYGNIRQNYAMNNNYDLTAINQRLADSTISFFQDTGLIPTFLIGYCLAAIAGLFLFSYLNDRKQINFYHSQPISRKKIFFSNYVSCLVLGVVPFLFSFGIALLVSFYNLGTNLLSVRSILFQITSFIAFYNISLAITILSCQFTGNKIFSLFVVGFLNFFVQVSMVIVVSAINGFSSTLNIASNFILKFSPITYYINSIVNLNKTLSLTQQVLFVLIATSILFVAYALYLTRPSEASENIIVYSPMGYFMKFITSFAIAYGFALLCSSIGGFSFFDISFIIAFFVLALFIEAIYKKSFKNPKKLFMPTLITTGIAFAIMFGITLYSSTLDRQIPNVDEITVISLEISGDFYTSDGNDNINITDRELIKEITSLLNVIVTTSNYDTSSSYYSSYISTENKFHKTLKVVYNNNKYLYHMYKSVDTSLILSEISSIYENETYKEKMIEKLTINNISDIKYLQANIPDYSIDYNAINLKSDEYVKLQPLIDALIMDVKNRKFEDIIDNHVGNLYINYYNDDFITSIFSNIYSTDLNLISNIYSTDLNLIKILEQSPNDLSDSSIAFND